MKWKGAFQLAPAYFRRRVAEPCFRSDFQGHHVRTTERKRQQCVESSPSNDRQNVSFKISAI